MAIFHGIWTEAEDLLLWGEDWRRLSPMPLSDWIPQPPLHPLSLNAAELLALIRSLPNLEELAETIATYPKVTASFPLPTQTLDPGTVLPLHSGQVTETDNLSLYSWSVCAYQIPGAQAFDLLGRLPLHIEAESWLGSDLRYWSHLARWVLDLWGQGKFIPYLQRVSTTPPLGRVQWQVRLDGGSDRLRFDRFCQQMPWVAQWWGQNTQAPTPTETPETSLSCPLPPPGHQRLRSWLNAMVDRGIRRTVQFPTPEQPLEPLFQDFWQGLTPRSEPVVLTEEAEADWERWQGLLQRWSQIEESETQQPFRAAMQLEAPAEARQTWTLHYGLYADAFAEFVPAAIVWRSPSRWISPQGNPILQGQERLLKGLGLAARVYPDLDASLDTAEPCQHSLSTSAAYTFIKTIAPRLQEQGVGVLLPEGLASGQGVANRLGLQVKAELAPQQGQSLGLAQLLQFRWELCLGGQTFSKAQFDRLVAQETPLVQVNGEWLELRPQDVTAARDFFKRRKDQPNLSLEDALRLSTGDVQTMSKLPVVNFEATGSLEALVTTLTGTQTVESLAVPPSFNGQLRPYQARGAGWLDFLHRWNLGACLADDMGLGKTIQFIAFLLHLHHTAQLERPYLLICPTSVLGNWEREVKRFAPDLKVFLHHGEKRAKGKTLKQQALKQHLVITSYSLVHRDFNHLKDIPWQGIVLDEAQNIKNAEAKQSVSVRELVQPKEKPDQPLPFRIALTGTPVENRLTELWSIMEFLNPGYLGTKAFFQRRFMMPIERYGDRDSLQALRSLVQPFILRRLKTDRSIIQDLPEKQETTVFCGLSPEQAALYQKTVDDTLTAIDAAEGIEKHGLVLALLTKLKQICNHPSLYLKEKLKPSKQGSLSEQVLEEFQQRSSKIQRLESLVDELIAEGDRALLFTQFVEWGHLLKAYFEARYNREILFLHGGTRKADRETMIDRFQEDPQAPRLLILSLKAGGVGLNLTRANHVFHVDRWWNPAVENQATDRAFRIGQTRKVQVHKFVCSGTLEERIHDLIESKKALAEQVVGTGESWLAQLDSENLRDLLLLNQDAIESTD
ncbi:MAG: DEAD/DEAH box helicase [Prochlorotrichaceae cyanobacterium]|jgi:hypothetical protein